MPKKPPFKDRVSKIYGDANRMCNELDSLISDLGMELSGRPYVKDFGVLGKLASMFEQACATRSQASDLSDAVRKLNKPSYKFDTFHDRFKWRKVPKKDRYKLMDTLYKKVKAEIYYDKRSDMWRIVDELGGYSPKSSAKSMVEFKIKRRGDY